MELSAVSDAELVGRITAADATARAAEQELCRRFASRTRLYGLKHLRDRSRAEDLMQLVLMRLLAAARAGQIEDVARVDRFVLGTCRLTAQRLRVRAQREQPGDDALAELAVDQGLTEEHLMACPFCSAAAERVAQLTQSLRELLPPIVSAERLEALRERGLRIVDNPMQPESGARWSSAGLSHPLRLHATRHGRGSADRAPRRQLAAGALHHLAPLSVTTPHPSECRRILA